MDTEDEEVRALALVRTLKAERAATWLTQADLARKADMPRITYTRYEVGDRQPTVIQVMAISDALGMTFSAFAHKIEARMAEIAAERAITQTDLDLAANDEDDPTEDELLRQEHPDDETA